MARADGRLPWLAWSPDRRAGASCFPGLSWADAASFIPRIFRDSRHRAAFRGIWLHSRSTQLRSFPQLRLGLAWSGWAPPAGFEPALTAPEAVALAPELWGLRASERVPAERPSRTRGRTAS